MFKRKRTLAGKERACKLGRMHVSEGMSMGVPATKAEIETTYASSVIVYDDYLNAWSVSVGRMSSLQYELSVKYYSQNTIV